jgi:hypothetical protein
MVSIPILISSIAAAAAALAGVAFVLFRLYSQLKQLREKQQASVTAADLSEFREGLAEIARRVSLVETDLAAVPAMPRGAINVSKRGQVIRLHRRGDDTAEIATAVGLRRSEVDLIIKMQKLAGSAAPAAVAVMPTPPAPVTEAAEPAVVNRPTAGSILRL